MLATISSRFLSQEFIGKEHGILQIVRSLQAEARDFHYLSIYLSIYPSIYLCISLSTYLIHTYIYNTFHYAHLKEIWNTREK
jgi:hypothetical protein